MTSHLRLSRFSNTGIDVRFSLKGILLTWFLAFAHSTLPSFLFSLTVLPSLADHYCFLHLLFWDGISTNQPQGSTQSLFQPSHVQRASRHSCPLWCHSGLIHGLLPAMRLPCPSAVFLGTIHEPRRIFLHRNHSTPGKHFPMQTS